jgi:hypothetical protein
MTRVQLVRWVLKPTVFVAALVPLGLLVRDTMTGGLGANPVEEITHRTGLTAITLLMLTLAVTPASQLLGAGWLIRLRRMLGLFAFTYAVLHFLMYVTDQTLFTGEGLSLTIVAEDVAERPYVTVGFATFLLLPLPLAGQGRYASADPVRARPGPAPGIPAGAPPSEAAATCAKHPFIASAPRVRPARLNPKAPASPRFRFAPKALGYVCPLADDWSGNRGGRQVS